MMDFESIKEAPTVEEAVDAALEELGVQQDAVEYEVLEEPWHSPAGTGLSRPARVRVWVKPEHAEALRAAQAASLDREDAESAVDWGDTFGAGPENQPPELSDEELDRVADAAIGVVTDILERLGIDSPRIEEYEGDEREIILDVIGDDLGLLIGRHGKTLDALQAVVSALTTKALGFRYPVVIDVEGYRHRRRKKVEEIARRAADRAARTGQPVRLRPMTAYERRVVHLALRNDSRVATASEGEEPFRQVVITPR